MSNSNDPLRLADSPHLHANPGCIWYAAVSRGCRKLLLSIVTLTTLFLSPNDNNICLLRFFFSLSSDKTSSSGTFLYTWIFYKVFVHVFFHSPDGFRKHRIPSIWSARREFQHGKKKKNFLFIFSHLVTALVSPIIIFIIILLSFVVKSVSEKKNNGNWL